MQRRIVITGSSRGLGLGLARAFIHRGHHVVLSGRTQTASDAAMASLAADARQSARMIAVVCDVADRVAVERLWAAAADAFGGVDVWINNAGIANKRKMVADMEAEELHAVLSTNLIGTFNGSIVALRGMKAQGTPAAIYNMEGYGSDSIIFKDLNLGTYAVTKSAITFLTRMLRAESQTQTLRIGTINPGTIVTDMVLAAEHEIPPEAWAQAKLVYEIFSEDVDVVSDWLVGQILRDPPPETIARLTSLRRLRGWIRFFLKIRLGI